MSSFNSVLRQLRRNNSKLLNRPACCSSELVWQDWRQDCERNTEANSASASRFHKFSIVVRTVLPHLLCPQVWKHWQLTECNRTQATAVTCDRTRDGQLGEKRGTCNGQYSKDYHYGCSASCRGGIRHVTSASRS